MYYSLFQIDAPNGHFALYNFAVPGETKGQVIESILIDILATDDAMVCVKDLLITECVREGTTRKPPTTRPTPTPGKKKEVSTTPILQ